MSSSRAALFVFYCTLTTGVGGLVDSAAEVERRNVVQRLGRLAQHGGAETAAMRAMVRAATPAALGSAAKVCESCCGVRGKLRLEGDEYAISNALDAEPLLARSYDHPCAANAICAQLTEQYLSGDYESYALRGAASTLAAASALVSSTLVAAAQQMHSRVLGINIWIGARSPAPVFWETLRTFAHAHTASVLDYVWFVDDAALATEANAYATLHGITNLWIVSQYSVGGKVVNLATFMHEKLWLATKQWTGRHTPATYKLAHNLCDIRHLFGIIFEEWIHRAPRLATTAAATYAPALSSYTHWGWIDQHTSMGDLAKFLHVKQPGKSSDGSIQSDLDMFDVLSFRFLDAAQIFTSGQLSIFRDIRVVNHIWESVGAERIKETFDRDATDPHVGRSLVFDEFRGSNAIILAPLSTRIRIKVSFVSALGPLLIVAQVAGGEGRLIAAASAHKDAAKSLQAQFDATAAAHNAAAKRRNNAQSQPLKLGVETAAVGDDTTRIGGAPLQPTWRDVALKQGDIAGRWLGTHLALPDRGFFTFWRDRDGRWFKRVPAAFAYSSSLSRRGAVVEGGEIMGGVIKHFDVVLTHTRGALCVIQASEVDTFSASSHSQCANS